MSEVIVVIGSGAIGLAIARRVSAGKTVLLADINGDAAEAAAETIRDAGFDARTRVVDVTQRESVADLAGSAKACGTITGMIHSAGVSPSSSPASVIFKVDLYGTAVVLEEFGRVIAPGGAGVVVSSHAGHRLAAFGPEESEALAVTPADELLDLDILDLDGCRDSLVAYQYAKRGASLRVVAEAVRWAERGARVNAISPGFVVSPLLRKELEGPNHDRYERLLEASAARRAGTPDEVAAVGALLMGPEGRFVSGSDFLVDGGVTAEHWYGEVSE